MFSILRRCHKNYFYFRRKCIIYEEDKKFMTFTSKAGKFWDLGWLLFVATRISVLKKTPHNIINL